MYKQWSNITYLPIFILHQKKYYNFPTTLFDFVSCELFLFQNLNMYLKTTF